jgi:hypothetical protein
MNTYKLITLLSINLIFLYACGSGNKSQQTGNLPVIDLSKNHPKKELILQEIATVEYVALETTNDVLLGQRSRLSHVSDRYIVVASEDGVYVFSRDGKIISHFNHRGQGPREYNFGGNFVFDEYAEEVFIFDTWSYRIQVYTISGEYKRTLRYPDELNIRESIYNFDNEVILVEDALRLTDNGHVFSEIPYLFLSKTDGSIVDLVDITLPTRYTNRIAQEITGAGGEKMFLPLAISVPNNRYFGQDFVIADISSDTIYKLTQDRRLTPLLARTPSVHASDPRVVLTALLNTDRYILLQMITLDFDAADRGRPIPNVRLFYDFETEETYEVTLVDNDLGRWFPGIFSSAISRNTDAQLIDVWRLKDAYEEGKLPERLQQFATSLDADDNPIVRIMTFK